MTLSGPSGQGWPSKGRRPVVRSPWPSFVRPWKLRSSQCRRAFLAAVNQGEYEPCPIARFLVRLLARDIPGRVVVAHYIGHANASAGLCLATADVLGILPDNLGEMAAKRFVGRRHAAWGLIPAAISVIQVIVVPLLFSDPIPNSVRPREWRSVACKEILANRLARGQGVIFCRRAVLEYVSQRERVCPGLSILFQFGRPLERANLGVILPFCVVSARSV